MSDRGLQYDLVVIGEHAFNANVHQ